MGGSEKTKSSHVSGFSGSRNNQNSCLKQLNSTGKQRGFQNRLWENAATRIDLIVDEIRVFGKNFVLEEVDQEVISKVLKGFNNLSQYIVRIDKQRHFHLGNAFRERRSGKDRRKADDSKFFKNGGIERRSRIEFRKVADNRPQPHNKGGGHDV